MQSTRQFKKNVAVFILLFYVINLPPYSASVAISLIVT